MRVVVLTPPEQIVTFEEVAHHLADVPAEDKSYVESLVAAATAWIDGPNTWLSRAIGVQAIEARIACFEWGTLPLPGPVLEIVEIGYVDVLGVERVVDPAVYELRGDRLGLAWGQSWPGTRAESEAVRIRYWAGYGKRDPDDAAKWINEAPPPIKVAIMMLVAQWYGTREPVTIGAAVADMPFAVDALLQPYRVYR